MDSRLVTIAVLESDPQYPRVPHVPLERLRLDSAHLPVQRQRPDGTPVCWGGDHDVVGGQRLCAACKSQSRSLSQERRRAALRPDISVSKTTLTRVHETIEGLSPLMLDLTVAYNNGGDLRQEVNRIMLAFKTLIRDVRDVLPDPRTLEDN